MAAGCSAGNSLTTEESEACTAVSLWISADSVPADAATYAEAATARLSTTMGEVADAVGAFTTAAEAGSPDDVSRAAAAAIDTCTRLGWEPPEG